MALDSRAECGKLLRVFARWADDALVSDTLDSTGGHDLTRAQFRCLDFLGCHDGCHIGDVAQGLGISDPAATKLVDRLESKGLAGRKASREDRRVVHVQLSDAGAHVVDRLGRRFQGLLASAIDPLTDQKLNRLTRSLEDVLLAALNNPRVIERVCLHCGDGHSPDCVINQAHIQVTGAEIGWL
ncbi:MAG: MarR family transcriptional regulator [Armatimonadota bacterium]|nr:MAG: MarR family transcriptional regulator [Armatimonadota bacterium]